MIMLKIWSGQKSVPIDLLFPVKYHYIKDRRGLRIICEMNIWKHISTCLPSSTEIFSFNYFQYWDVHTISEANAMVISKLLLKMTSNMTSIMMGIASTSQQQCTQPTDFASASVLMFTLNEYSLDTLPPSLPSPVLSSSEEYIVRATTKPFIWQAWTQTSELFHQKSLTNFQHYPLVGSENWQPRQHQTTCIAEVVHFDHSIAFQQSSNKLPDEN